MAEFTGTPYLLAAQRKTGVVFNLTDDDRQEIAQGAQEFVGELCARYDPSATRRVALRQFFAYLRERVKIKVTIAKALDAVDYCDLPAERELAEEADRAERRHNLELQSGWRHSRGCV